MTENINIIVPIQLELLSEQLLRARPLGPWRITLVGRSWESLQPRLLKRLAKQTPQTLPSDLFSQRLPADFTHWRTSLELPPQHRDARWTQPLTVELDCFRWVLESGLWMIRVPAVDCHLLGKPAELDERLVGQHARAALLRVAENMDLLALSTRFANRRFEFRSVAVDVPVGGPVRDRGRAEQRKQFTTLRATASDLARTQLPEVYGLDEKAAELAEHFSGQAPHSVLLVGAAGVGKTALVMQLVKLAKGLGLGDRRVWSTSGARIVSGMSGLGMWQQRSSKLIREAHASGAIIHFGSLFELMEAGRVDDQPGVASMVRQAIARGKLWAIAECTPEQLAIIERQDPLLLRAFAQVELKELPANQVRLILSSAAEHDQVRTQLSFSPQAIEELYRLHSRFATYSALPAVALQLMRTMADDWPSGGHLQPEDVARAFAKQTGLPRFLVDDSIPLDLPAVTRQLTEQVIGQTEPVELIVNLMATLKARLIRPGRPLASLMFIGPTGVGKTEMAKALARLLYSDSSRMLRIDMSEYASPWSVSKLIGKAGEGDGTLTSPIREQPFSVVLLDEFEKADAQVYDLLLQLLGEGRLTDSQGRLADFRNAVIIMTSNLGAATFKDAAMGFADNEQANWREHFEHEVRRHVRPEFLGRLDRIVPFRPLPKAIVRQIAHRELEKLAQRPGVKYRDAALEFDESAIDLVCEMGYQPKYGARPLRRAIELHLAVPIANALSRLAPDHTWLLQVTAAAGEFTVQTRKLSSKTKTDKAQEVQLINAWQQLGRMARTARHSGPMRDLENELERVTRQNRLLKKKSLERQLQQNQLVIDASNKLRERLLSVSQRICDQQLRLMNDWYRGAPMAWDSWRGMWNTELTQLRQAIEGVIRRRLTAVERFSLIINGRGDQQFQVLWRTYRQLAAENGWSLEAYLLREHFPSRSGSTAPAPVATADNPATDPLQPQLSLYATPLALRDLASSPVADGYRLDDNFATAANVTHALGLALQFQGPGVESWLEDEEGVLHFYYSATTGPKRRQRFRVMAFPLPLISVALPVDWQEPVVPQVRDPRRLIDLSAQTVSHDRDLITSFATGKPHEGLLEHLRAEHEQALWEGIGYHGIPSQALLGHVEPRNLTEDRSAVNETS